MSVSACIQFETDMHVLLAEKTAQIQAATSILNLLEVLRGIIGTLLRRGADTAHRDKMLAMVTKYFMSEMNGFGTPQAEKLVKLKRFSVEICGIVILERPVLAKTASPEGRRESDKNPESLAGVQPTKLAALQILAEEGGANDDLAPNTALTATADRIVGLAPDADILTSVEPTSIIVVDLPRPFTCETFKLLLAEAICYRISGVTSFFQRENPKVLRELPRPFLLSSHFADRLCDAVREIIVPRMIAGSRNIAMMETGRAWGRVNTAEFWEIVEEDEKYRNSILAAWDAAWGNFRQRREMRGDKPVLVASPDLLELRKRLAPAGDEFVAPPIRNAEIDVFVSLLFEFDVSMVERNWEKLRQLYEQEMDRRVYQDKARVGALRDSLLSAFDALPDTTGDFLALLCYFCFPHVDLYFLDRFTHNKGANAAERKRRIPYLMQFLADERMPHILLRENQERQERENNSKRKSV